MKKDKLFIATMADAIKYAWNMADEKTVNYKSRKYFDEHFNKEA